MQLGDANLHFWLTRSVGRVMGVDFTAEMANKRLTPKAYADLVTECRSCPLVKSCQGWLSAQSEVTRCAPPGCRNSKELESLARPH